MQNKGVFVPVTLGMLTAFGPFVTDFYLPAMPEMADFFGVSPSIISMSLTMGMLGLAAGQLIIGPLSDKYGRKPLLLISMVIFAVASVFCVVAPDAHVFNTLRFLQGLGGAGGIVLSKSISTDMFSGKDLVKFLALLGAINGIAPVCAPVLGGVISNFMSWKGIFLILLAIGVVLLFCCMGLRETLARENRQTGNAFKSYENLFKVFRNKVFRLSTFAMVMSFFCFFGYISSSTFILQNIYGMSPLVYGLGFGVNAVSIAVGAALAPRLGKDTVVLKGGSLVMLVAALLAAVTLLLHASVWLVFPCYTVMMFGFGLMQPAGTAIALDSERNNSGSASAIFGALGFVAGAIASPVVAAGNILVSASIVYVIGALGALGFAVLLHRAVGRRQDNGVAKSAA